MESGRCLLSLLGASASPRMRALSDIDGYRYRIAAVAAAQLFLDPGFFFEVQGL